MGCRELKEVLDRPEAPALVEDQRRLGSVADFSHMSYSVFTPKPGELEFVFDQMG